ncbi:ATP-dependent DNA ligase [Streptomyces sp. NBC_00019]|uniref:ATP-dependent DNA ligase n=1 Tax=Streptomyces sp. NBC_00019 TaxID=2975623 RepID=UPI00386CE459
MHRRGAAAARAAVEFPAHLVAFELLRVHGSDLTGLPFSDRYAALQALFLEEGLSAPWSLCPTTTDPEQAAAWLADYTAVGIECLVFRPLASRYVPGGRGWTKYTARHTVEAIEGVVTGSLRAPTTALLGAAATRAGACGTPAAPRRWARPPGTPSPTSCTPGTPVARGRGAPSVWGWGSREQLPVHLVVPEVAAEVAVASARDSARTLAPPGPAHPYPPRHGARRGAAVRSGFLAWPAQWSYPACAAATAGCAAVVSRSPGPGKWGRPR